MDLLERDDCLEQLGLVLSDAVDGRGHVALVSGEAGIGKTTMIRRLAEHSRASVRVLWGNCDAQFTPRPLGPLWDMATQLRGAVPRLLGASADRGSMFAAVLAELCGQPTLAVFEDLHWADDATLDLLGFLSRRVSGCPVLLVCTYRNDELGLRHPLRLLLGDLVTSHITSRIVLAPLTVEAVRTLVGGRAVDAGELHRRTAGNPFFVTEVLANEGVAVPPTVRDAVLARVARLTPPAQELLQAAAVVGPRIEAATLADMGFSDTTAIDECLGNGMLAVQSDDLLAFRHELARRAVLETLSPPRREGLHRKALAVLRAVASQQRDLARLAHHAEGARDCAAILEFAPAAARQAAASTAHRAAAAQYRLALRCADDLPPAERASLLEAYSAQCNTTDQRTEAIAAGWSAIGLWQACGEIAKRSENLAHLVPMLIGVAQLSEAERCSREAIALLEALPHGSEYALACRMQALVALARRDTVTTIQWGERAIDLAQQCGADEVAGMTAAAVGSARMIEDPVRGRDYLEKFAQQAVERGQRRHAANAYNHLVQRCAELYQLDRAERYAAAGLSLTDGTDLETIHLLILAWHARVLMHRGEWTECAAVARYVLRRDGMSAGNRLPALVAFGRLHTRAGLAEGRDALDEAMALTGSIDTSETLGLVRAARAEAAWLAGNPAGVVDEAGAGYAIAIRERNAWIAGELAYWQWKAGAAVPRRDWWAEPFAAQIAGDWRRASVAWSALGCPYEAARALAEGDAHARRDALEQFTRLGADHAARNLARTMRAAGAGHLPRGPYTATRADPFGLTPRQADVLRLLSEGLSNPEIAERLALAPKTVDHHVAAVLAKLDVHSRKAAAAVARRSTNSRANWTKR